MDTPNRLAEETSFYLKRHSNTPVDWYPWGKEALKRAKDLNRPIFLSIGYLNSSLCQKMLQENFEDPALAELLNRHFINIKVDSDERPDIEKTYRLAGQLLAPDLNGFPLCVFLTPDTLPFYTGGYFPRNDADGVIGFKKLVGGLANAWRTRGEELKSNATQLVTALKESLSGSHVPVAANKPNEIDLLEQLQNDFDAEHGGFASMPKHYYPHDLRHLIRGAMENKASLNQLKLSLTKILNGGVYDHLEGSFFHFAKDAAWQLPDFEKRLNVNALLAEVFIEAMAVDGDLGLYNAVQEICFFITHTMTTEAGYFLNSIDSGGNGDFYSWSLSELNQLLGNDLYEIFCLAFGIEKSTIAVSTTILHQTLSLSDLTAKLGSPISEIEDSISVAKRKLIAARHSRPQPQKDYKGIVSSNGMAIHSLALASTSHHNKAFLDAAIRAAQTILERFSAGSAESRLTHCHERGQSPIPAFLDDYAFLGNALLTLFETTFEPSWLDESLRVAETILQDFVDRASGSFFFTAQSQEVALIRLKDEWDGPIPSSTGMAIFFLDRLHRFTGKSRYGNQVARSLSLMHHKFSSNPRAYSSALLTPRALGRKHPLLLLVCDDSSSDAKTLIETFSDIPPLYATKMVATPSKWKELRKLTEHLDDKKIDSSLPQLFQIEEGATTLVLQGDPSIKEFLLSKSSQLSTK